jgi:nicotinamidase-related amidase
VTKQVQALPVPEFYDAGHARRWGYRPEQATLLERASAWRATHRLGPAGGDARKIVLLVIDAQKDFCFPEGSLFVGGRSGTGAMDDSDRLARFIYRELGRLSEIICTLDSHDPFQIFFPSFWLDRAGAPPAAHREITTDDIRRGDVQPNPAVADWLRGGDLAWLRREVEHYCAELERAGKYRLYLWPPHCLTGSDGHALAGVIHEARLFHAFARGARNGVELKGSHPLTENYSALSPEVLTRFDGLPLAARNAALTETLLAADTLVVAGQAASHCVKSTLEDLLREIAARDSRLAQRVYILRDCMSSVAVPDPAKPGACLVDFTPQAEAALARFADAGMHLVDSTTDMATWPDLT